MHSVEPYRQSAELGLIDLGFDEPARAELLERIISSEAPLWEVLRWADARLLDLLKRRNSRQASADALLDVQALRGLLRYAMACASQLEPTDALRSG